MRVIFDLDVILCKSNDAQKLYYTE